MAVAQTSCSCMHFVNAVFFSFPTPYGFDMINIKSIRNTRNFAPPTTAELNWKIWLSYDLGCCSHFLVPRKLFFAQN